MKKRLNISSSLEELTASMSDASGTPDSETTGRYLVLFREGASKEAAAAMASTGGMRVASAADYKDAAVNLQELEGIDALVFPEIGVAVVSAEPNQVQALDVTEQSPIEAVEPERIVYALAAPTPVALPSLERGIEPAYLKGYKDAVDHLVGTLLNGSLTVPAEEAVPVLAQVATLGGCR